MDLVPIMWSIWGFVVLLFVAVKLYVFMLAQANSGQLILDGSAQKVPAQQTADTPKLKMVRLAERVLLWAVLAITAILLAFHAMNWIK